MKKLVALGGAAIAPLLLSAVIQVPKLFFIISNLFNFGPTLNSDFLKILFGSVLGGVVGNGNVFLGIFVAF